MLQISYNNLPEAIQRLNDKLDNIERLLLHESHANAQESDKILVVSEAANFLKLSVPTIYGLVHKRKIPYMKQGKRLYFLEQELMQWLKEGKGKTESDIRNEADNILVSRKGGVK